MQFLSLIDVVAAAVVSLSQTRKYYLSTFPTWMMTVDALERGLTVVDHSPEIGMQVASQYAD